MRRLLIRPGGIGDCLLCFPAMRELRADFTEVWVPSAVVPLVRFADAAHSIASTGLDSLAMPRQCADRLRGFDSIVSWHGANREEFIATCRALELSIEFRAAIPPMDCDAHAVDFFLRRASDLYPSIEVPHAPEPFIAIHPFSGSTHKNWPLELYRELEARLPLPARHCIGPEQTLAGAVQYASLYDLACWLRAASLYIGNDSGITHLAAAAGAPTVALFGYSNPRVWAPRGANVRVVQAPSLLDITVDAVLRVALDLLR